MTLLKKIYLKSCFEELEILKPGNHSVQSKIIGMYESKFKRAAKLSSDILVDRNLTIGESINFSAKKCFKELGANYNLGIILLCAPVLKLSQNQIKNFCSELKFTLTNISERDGLLILQAIKEMKPAGIENYDGKGDVKLGGNTLKFNEVMIIGSNWDRISSCYTNSYSEILNQGLPHFISLKKKLSYEDSVSMLFLNYLSRNLDSHILRKWGKEKASKIMNKSRLIEKSMMRGKFCRKRLFDFDNYLKVFHYNPGTCADLTVTTLLISKIRDIFKFPV
tara:strand:+ start:302 stop:1138 length:837 start_codon:yes stop_codon:yes gene_type:complete